MFSCLSRKTPQAAQQANAGTNVQALGCQDVTVTITLDQYPAAMGWQVIGTPLSVSPGSYTGMTPGSVQTQQGCLIPGDYTFSATSTLGGGWNGGQFQIQQGTQLLAFGTFCSGSSFDKTFTVMPPTSVPPSPYPMTMLPAPTLPVAPPTPSMLMPTMAPTGMPTMTPTVVWASATPDNIVEGRTPGVMVFGFTSEAGIAGNSTITLTPNGSAVFKPNHASADVFVNVPFASASTDSAGNLVIVLASSTPVQALIATVFGPLNENPPANTEVTFNLNVPPAAPLQGQFGWITSQASLTVIEDLPVAKKRGTGQISNASS